MTGRSDVWTRRAARARALASSQPAVADTLLFYAALSELQSQVPGLKPGPSENLALPPAFAGTSDGLRHFVGHLMAIAPPALGDALRAIDIDASHWSTTLDTMWRTGGREPVDLDDVSRFIAEAILQPSAEAMAMPADRPAHPSQCPRCTGEAVVGMLREQGHGARRSLVCGFCLLEWPARRMMCPVCGEQAFEKLPVFRADQLSVARVDACDACQTYLKTIDLTRDGHADPIADDIATVSLDLWAREQGYRRSRANLLRL